MPKSRNEPETTDPVELPEAGTLFGLLLGRGDAPQVYTAMREIQAMAGKSVVVELTGLIRTIAAEQSAQFQAAFAEQGARIQDVDARLTARLDSVDKQLSRMWTLLFLLLATLVGTLTTLLTTLLLRG